MDKYVVQKLVLLRGLLLLILVETNYRVSPCTGVNKINCYVAGVLPATARLFIG